MLESGPSSLEPEDKVHPEVNRGREESMTEAASGSGMTQWAKTRWLSYKAKICYREMGFN